MATRVIVLIADRGDPKHGEIAVLDGTAEAERLVETLLEAGFDREQVRVFAGAEMEALVSQRPKVQLVADDLDAIPPGSDPLAQAEAQPREAAGEASGGEGQPQNGSSSPVGGQPVQPVEMMPELLH